MRYGVGYETDLAALTGAGIPFANNPDYGTEEVADHALAMILSLHRRLWEHDARARGYSPGWQVHSLKPLSRSNRATVGVRRRRADRNRCRQSAETIRLPHPWL